MSEDESRQISPVIELEETRLQSWTSFIILRARFQHAVRLNIVPFENYVNLKFLLIIR